MTEPPPLPDPGERGTLTVDHTVVRKVARRAADRVDGTARVERRIAGIGVGEHRAGVTISEHGNDVDLALDLALRYPAPVREVAAAVRAAVTAEVGRITGYRVRGVAITVSTLRPDVASHVV
ncbi:Uncharacterized conserved protein YloU, alkaline shock protein (Asp23) family [Amycolatopsis arida]|uniref:Uncharacterized conserved protein YloU, alkaline shock protein (Asp23) family n=1 Tax=Amycolatopsis arida TaxID=587909 RepID=A0A1I5ZV11_9PSEU|nr:Asp23/Gls24 family envelope stress response protein [Amycolatopsis arida]TDX89388.1 putative alkaline shock family protein YloU [Amycolatopsis arida]SFQ60298.1 Uncharacterized conserved protein YloU, alkaline shock protein (Asp23) family [Amycolatopsis arida]